MRFADKFDPDVNIEAHVSKLRTIFSSSILAITACSVSQGQTRTAWPETGLYYVETDLVFEALDEPLTSGFAAYGAPILTRYAHPVSTVVLSLDVEDEGGIARVGAGMVLLQSSGGGVPGIVYCGRALQNAPSGVALHGCLVDSDADGYFDHRMGRASPIAPPGPLVVAAASPVPLNEPVPYVISHDVDQYRFGFELFNADGSFPSVEHPEEVIVRMRHFDGAINRGAEGQGIQILPEDAGTTYNLWGVCLRVIEIKNQQIHYELLSVDDDVLSWAERSIIDWNSAFKCQN